MGPRWGLVGPFLLFYVAFLAPVRAQMTSFCPVYERWRADGGDLKLALQGLSPTMAVFRSSGAAYMKVTEQGPQSGFLYDILEKIARSGRFSWNYTLIPDQLPEQTDDLWFANVTRNFDSVARVGWDTSIRRSLGLAFTPGIIDASVIMIANRDTDLTEQTTNFVIWMYPFTWELWGAVLGALVLHALAQLAMEHLYFDGWKPRIRHWNAVENYLYLSFSNFTGTDALQANKRTSRALLLVFSFVVFVIVASYAANLTSALLLANSTSLKIIDMSDANMKRARVCFRKTSAAIAIVTSRFTQIQPVITVNSSNAEVLQMLQDGQCDVAILAQNDWELLEGSDVNIRCNLEPRGPPVRQLAVTLPFQNDIAAHCTSFFGQVLSALLVAENELQQTQMAWAATVKAGQRVDCKVVAAAQTDLYSGRLGINFLYGLFVLYAASTVVILAVHFTDWEWIGRKCAGCCGKRGGKAANGGADGLPGEHAGSSKAAVDGNTAAEAGMESGLPSSESLDRKDPDDRSSGATILTPGQEVEAARRAVMAAMRDLELAMEAKFLADLEKEAPAGEASRRKPRRHLRI
ncbi:hypothetical protein DFJ74DRAFT_655371 [Hyaloraphidium curvatum]|nr:hypothetical protein DFJ74DRAFT_655371 [Hyaloraphidium curvatum]